MYLFVWHVFLSHVSDLEKKTSQKIPSQVTQSTGIAYSTYCKSLRKWKVSSIVEISSDVFRFRFSESLWVRFVMLLSPLLGNSLLFPRERDGNACAAAMPWRERLWSGVCWWIPEKVLRSDSLLLLRHLRWFLAWPKWPLHLDCWWVQVDQVSWIGG